MVSRNFEKAMQHFIASNEVKSSKNSGKVTLTCNGESIGNIETIWSS